MFNQHRRRPQHYQHFLQSRELVNRLVRLANFSITDTVLEIGPGKGIITRELLNVAGCVIAIEIDPTLTHFLCQKFSSPNLILFNQDFNHFPLPQTPFHVFANLPFAKEGGIVRRLLYAPNFQSAHLIVIKDVGFRWVGFNHASLFSLTHQPWFDMHLVHRFKRSDFDPPPRIDSVMIAIKKRQSPLLSLSQKQFYSSFLLKAFSGGRRINQNLKPFFTPEQLFKLSRQYHFSYHAKPTDLTLNHWLNLYTAVYQ